MHIVNGNRTTDIYKLNTFYILFVIGTVFCRFTYLLTFIEILHIVLNSLSLVCWTYHTNLRCDFYFLMYSTLFVTKLASKEWTFRWYIKKRLFKIISSVSQSSFIDVIQYFKDCRNRWRRMKKHLKGQPCCWLPCRIVALLAFAINMVS